MHVTSDASFCLWNSGSYEAITEAQKRKATVHLQCWLPVGGELAGTHLEGVLSKVDGREALFAVCSVTACPARNRAVKDSCEFYFCLERSLPSGERTRLGIQGSALVLEIHETPDGGVQSVLLRFPRNCSVRQLRGDKRIPWRDEYSRIAGVAPTPERLSYKEDLRAFLAVHCRNRLDSTRLINISAGGACVCLPEELASSSLSFDTSYLFFLVPSLMPVSAPPFVFLARKMGLGRDVCDAGAAVRLRFQEELDWSGRQAQLKWQNIDRAGSSRLRLCLALYGSSAASSRQA